MRKTTGQSIAITLLSRFGGPTPGAAQNTGNLPPGPPIVYVSNRGGGITEINTANHSVVATAPFPSNSERNVVGRYNGPDGVTQGYFLKCVSCDARHEGRLN